MFLQRKKIISILLVSTFMLVGVFGVFNLVLAQITPITDSQDSDILNRFSMVSDEKNDNVQPKKSARKKDLNDTENSIVNVIAWVLFYIATFFSWLVSLLAWVMVYVASYNHFLDMPIVINGWKIVRDIANNFFIVILLVIAVGTILRVPNYNRQLLPKLLVMAVLINFSKVFTGIMIDFSQVLTLWFASAIQQQGGSSGGIILTALGLHQLYELSSSANFTTSWTEKIPGFEAGDAIKTLFFALILSVVAVVVIAIITIILVFRIVMLWFIVILSPLAFLLSTFPKGQQYSGQWWSELGKYLVVGPVMLFFLYLSLFSGANINNPSSPTGEAISYTAPGNEGVPALPPQTDDGVKLGINDFTSSPVKLFDFIIIVGLMVGSLVMGSKTGVVGASLASKGVSGLTNAAKKYSGSNLLQKGASTLPGAVVKGTAKKAGRGALAITSALLTGSKNESLNKIGQFAGAARKDLLASRVKAKTAKRDKLLRKIGLGDDAIKAWGGVADSSLGKGVKNVATGALGVGAIVAGAVTGGAAWIPALMASAAAFSPALKTAYTAKTKAQEEKDKTIIADSEQVRTDDYNKAKDARDSVVAGITDPINAKTNAGNYDKDTGEGLDQRVIDLLNQQNHDNGAKYFADPVAVAKATADVVARAMADNAAVIETADREYESAKATADTEHEERLSSDTGVKGYARKKAKRDQLTAERDAELSRIKDNRADTITRIDTDGSLTSYEKTRQKNEAKKRFDQQESEVISKYNPQIKKTSEKSWMQKQFGDYHPNKVTMDVVKKITVDEENMKKIIGSLAGGANIHEFGKSTFYAEGGQTAKHERFFKTLSDGSEKSNNALKNIADTLQMVQAGISAGNSISKTQADNLIAFKQGLAAYKLGGGDMTYFSQIITDINNITTNEAGKTNYKLAKTVEDHESSVISK